MKIVFMGTPDPAVKCLQALIDAQEQIIAVVTQPDRKKGRGLFLAQSPVKELAQKYKIPLETPEKIKDQIFIEKIRSYNPDLIVVAAYGKILPKEILAIPKQGAINIHASLLPKYRGAAPIQWALLKGETKTGVTIMYLSETLDTGDIIAQKEIEIKESDNAGTLLEKLFEEGSILLLKAIAQIKNGTAKKIPQNNKEATYAPSITKETGEIDWRKPAIEINNQVRALVPWPVAHTFYNKKMLKIWESEAGTSKAKGIPGEAIIENGRVEVLCGNDSLLLKIVQLEGGKKMDALAFARGRKLVSKTVLPC